MKTLLLCCLGMAIFLSSCSTAQNSGKIRLHDIWGLESMDKEKISLGERTKRPQLEIDLTKMTVAGNDGCNNFTGGIASVDAEKLVFGNIAVTRKLCVDMQIPDKFQQYLSTIQTYSLKDLKLYLYDSDGNERLTFRKID